MNLGGIIVLNLGSTSYKFKLFTRELEQIATGAVERVGGGASPYKISVGSAVERGEWQIATHEEAFAKCWEALVRMGAMRGIEDMDAVCYKAVHGGRISGVRLVDDEVIAEMERMTAFAPAHNPIYLKSMRGIREKYPALTQVACFETAFHQTIPLYRAIYGAPYEWIEKYGLRRYGFHGASHSYIAMRMAGVRRVISCHLGGSSSICAILDGKSVANSFGATLQSGLFQNNRAGDLDAYALAAIAKDGDIASLMDELSHSSGLLGVSGTSNDMRDLEAAIDAGCERAKLAVDGFVDSIIGYIGMYAAYLGGLDALVFTGGIGLNDARLRARVCEKLGYLGVTLDGGATGELVSPPDVRPAVYAIETNEELMVARGALAALNGDTSRRSST